MGSYDKHAVELKLRLEKDIEFWKNYKANLSAFLKAGKYEQYIVSVDSNAKKDNTLGVHNVGPLDVDRRISIVNEIDVVDKIINTLIRIYGG